MQATRARAAEARLALLSTMATSTPARASSPASITPVGPPPAITTACSVTAMLPRSVDSSGRRARENLRQLRGVDVPTRHDADDRLVPPVCQSGRERQGTGALRDDTGSLGQQAHCRSCSVQ